jgi:hypothetical protein
MQARALTASFDRLSAGRIRAVALSAVVLAATVAAPAAVLAKGTPAPTTNSISLNGSASYGSMASFTIVDPPVKSVQEVSVTCGANNTQVYLDVHTQNDANWLQFSLWSQAWQDMGGGPASCTAQLFYYTWKGHTETGLVVEATTTFQTS